MTYLCILDAVVRGSARNTCENSNDVQRDDEPAETSQEDRASAETRHQEPGDASSTKGNASTAESDTIGGVSGDACLPVILVSTDTT